jgi:polysaccharide pyruvyl transferase WcaK-like protein
MKILHLASHYGNIGDNASHMGFRNILTSLGASTWQIDKLEIRRFYNNYSLPDKCRFDADFAAHVNTYDAFVIGGGGFLDFWVENSITGTTLNIPPEVLDLIRVPLIITSVGCMPHKVVPEGNIEKFRRFLDQLLAKPNAYVAVRNDGSKDTLREFIGTQYHDAIPEILDHGFFYENDGSLYRASEKPYILINTTADQVHMENRNLGKIDEGAYVREMGAAVNRLIADTELDIAFAPHIYSDYKAIDAILKHVNDFHIRTRVAVAPFAQGDFGCNQIYAAYKNSAVVAGMRFHANVCSIALGVKSIGLAALDRVQNMYDSLGYYKAVVRVDRPFADDLVTTVQRKLQEPAPAGHDVLEQRKRETLAFYQSIFSQLF